MSASASMSRKSEPLNVICAIRFAISEEVVGISAPAVGMICTMRASEARDAEISGINGGLAE